MEKELIWLFSNRPTTKEKIMAHVGNGWWPLVDKLIDDLFLLGWNGYIGQIKEKFGGLCFYIGTGNDEIFERIRQAENDSYKICEVCGKPGMTRTDGWMKTLCEEHGENRPTQYPSI